jgi:hypothetical protein
MKKEIITLCLLAILFCCSYSVALGENGPVAWWKFSQTKGNAGFDSISQVLDEFHCSIR